MGQDGFDRQRLRILGALEVHLEEETPADWLVVPASSEVCPEAMQLRATT